MRGWLVLLLTVLSAAGCEDTQVELRLTSEERRQVDDRVSLTMDSLRPLLDSLCTVTFEDRVAVAVDSIIQERLEEELRLRARLRQRTGR